VTECWLIRHGNSASDLEMVSCSVYRQQMLKIITLAIALLVLPSVSASGQDSQKGLTAAQSGDFATALREWTPLAEQGDDHAQNNLGIMYANGQGVPQDYKAAVRWYTLAAEQGLPSAQNNLGVMYNNGQGVPQDYKAAVKWYTLAAEQGHARAQNNLGFMYDKGQGVLQDYKAAVRWYTLAAEQGHAAAQFNLGVMYNNGQGVLQDYIRSHMWLNIAASVGGNEIASKNRDIAAKKMTPAQIAEAQKLARECVAKNFKDC